MVGVLIATHGKLSEGLMDSVALIMGEQEQVETLSIVHETNISSFGDEIISKVESLDQGKGVLIFVDLYSASPYNQVVLNRQSLSHVQHRVVTGVNLPMLLETLVARHSADSVEDLWELAMTSGKDGIKEFETEFESFKR